MYKKDERLCVHEVFEGGKKELCNNNEDAI